MSQVRVLTVGCAPSDRKPLIAVIVSIVLMSCSVPGPTPEQILSDGVVTQAEYQEAGRQVVTCMTRLGFQAEMQLEGDRQPSFTVRDEFRSNEAFVTCHGRHIGAVELAWAAQYAPTPEEEARFYNSVVSCVESAIGEELGKYTGQADSELLDELLDAYRAEYTACFDSIAGTR